MKIEITGATGGNWYRNYIGSIFEVEPHSTGYTLINTPENESILMKEPNIERKGELLKRLRNTRGFRLGVSNENSVEITKRNNKEFSKLLSREW